MLDILPSARLVLPRLLLLKSDAQDHGKFMHSGKHALYGNPPRWHKITPDKPAPKGAPIAAHPHAAGKHEAAAHFTPEQWAALKLPDSNVNAPSYNKALDKLKEWSDAGNVTAIVGAGYGSNTYGQKLAKIANHLLGLYGSQHQVVAGQKAGTHAATLNAAPAEPHPTGLPEHLAPKPPRAEALPPLAEHVKDTLDAKAAEGDVEFIKLVAANNPEHPQIVAYAQQKLAELQAKAPAPPPPAPAPAPAPAAPDALVMPAFEEGKTTTGVKSYYEKQAQKVIDHAQAGNVAVLEDMKADGLKPNAKGKVPNTWQGKTANSKKLLALHAAALAHAKGGAAPSADQPVPTAIQKKDGANSKSAAIPAFDTYSDAQAWAKARATEQGLSWQAYTATPEYKDHVHPALIQLYQKYTAGFDAESEAVGKKLQAAMADAGVKPGDTVSWTQVGQFLSETKMSGVVKLGAHGIPFVHLDHEVAVAKPGGKIGYTKKLRWQPYMAISDAGPKEGDTKPSADGGTLVLKDGHWAKQSVDAPAATHDTGPLTAQQLQNLQSIPWHKLKLPDTNTNAKSHNAAVAKIEAMAFAGDTAGLQSFIDGKAGAKQTYAKKQHLLAQTALAALQEPGVTAAWAAAAAAAGPTPEQLADLVSTKVANKVFSPEQNALWSNLTPGQKDHVIYQVTEAQKAHNDPHGLAGKPALDAIKVAKDETDDDEQVIAVVAKNWLKANPGGEQQLSEALVAHGHSVIAADMGLPFPDAEEQEQASDAAKQGPQDGDTKPAADGGTLVFKDGHWHKQREPKPAPAVAAPQDPVDAVQVPDFQALSPDKWGPAYANVAAHLKQLVKDHGAAGLKGVVTTHGGGESFSIKIAGLHLKKIKPHPGAQTSNQAKRWAAMHQFVTELKAAAGKPSKKPKVASATAPQQAAPAAAATAPGTPPSMDAWQQIGGQGGSNPGGKFKDPTGQEWYCKFPGDTDTAKSEVLAAKLYALAGLSGQDAMLITKDGKVGIASKWTNITKASSAAALAKVPGALDGFAVDAWLGNWDVVGMALDNLQIGPDGKAHRVDAGGSLEYRAQGAKKPFGPKVEEIDTLRDAKLNPHSAAVFKGIKQADLVASVAKVAAISDVAIRAMVNEFGPGDAAAKAKLAETLIARKKDLLTRFPQAAKAKKKHTFDPSKISSPPSFVNWGGTGKSGPSSKEFLNQANEDAVQAIFAAAKSGDLAAVQKLTAPVFDKDTGKVVGQKPVLEHPSQHVKGYAQQAINEINYQLNPPKRFRFDGGHPLHALNNAYPAHAGAGSSAIAQKLGKFIVLGEPGTVKLEDVGLPEKITHTEGGGTLSIHTYAAAAKAAFAKMPATQKQAIQSYTGSSYHAMNGSLWTGNPSGAAKAAGEALKTLGHDIQPGTVLSRKISLHGNDLQQLLGAQGKVLQEPAIMSTSIRPSSWSGNVHLKLHVGPGVKGLWVGKGSSPSGGAVSNHSSEDELILPPNTRLMVISTKAATGKDADGFGAHGGHVIECIVLPTQ